MTEADPQQTPRRTRLPRELDFWRLWLVGLVLFGVRWIEMLAIAIFVYQRTGSAFTVTMLTMLRILPMALFGAVLGATADHLERRTSLLVVVLAMLTTSVTLAYLASTDQLEVWHLAVASFIGGTGWASDNSVRRMMIGEVVGPDRMATAMALNSGANNASRMIGPTIGGILLATAGIKGAFILGAVLYLGALIAVFGVRVRNRIGSPDRLLARIIEGWALLRSNAKLIGIFVITAIFNLFAWPCLSLVPVIAQDNLLLGPEEIGLLASMDGVGAVFGAIGVALYARPSRYAQIYAGSAALYLTMLIGFALMPVSLLAGAMLFMTGFGGSGFAVMQTTLIYRSVEPVMRARILGLLTVCIGIGPLGFVQVGLLAELIGAKLAVVTIATEGVLALLLTRRLWRVAP